MTAEQKQNMLEAKDAESTVILVELTEDQVAALKAVNALDARDVIATSAFASALRGKVQAEIDRNIKAHYLATSKNKPAVAAEAQAEINRLMVVRAAI